MGGVFILCGRAKRMAQNPCTLPNGCGNRVWRKQQIECLEPPSLKLVKGHWVSATRSEASKERYTENTGGKFGAFDAWSEVSRVVSCLVSGTWV